jgi:membrane protein DedA with SNARE-associated domain
MLWSAALLALGYFGGQAMFSAISALHHSRVLALISVSILLAAIIFVGARVVAYRIGRSQRSPAAAGVDR